jgi:P27 family predicted phage terminase small subunit
MRPGPARKPVALVRMEGNRGHRSLPKPEEEITPLALMPEAPSWLAPEAQREWTALAPKLFRLGLLTEVDGAALAAYCSSLATWARCQRVLDEEGLVVVLPNGYTQQHAMVAIANKALDKIRQFGSEFGLSPASRSRLHVPAPGDPVDPIADLLD